MGGCIDGCCAEGGLIDFVDVLSGLMDGWLITGGWLVRVYPKVC